MNVLLFLTPKKEVAYLYEDYSLRQALEKMEYHRYSAIPIISRNGNYLGTLTEGDLLWYIKNSHNLSIHEAEEENIMKISRYHDNKAIKANCDLMDVFQTAMNQIFYIVRMLK